MDKDSGLIHSVVTTVAHVSDGVVAAELLHGEERVVYGDAVDQGLEKREEMAGPELDCRIAMGPGKRRHLPDDGEGAVQRWMERAKAHVRVKVEHPFSVLKEQFGFRKTRRRGLVKNHSKVMVLAALSNLFLGPKKLLTLVT